MEIHLQSGRKIGAGHAPYIVAEVGSNIRNFEDAKNSVALAAQCGASAVKFQLYGYQDLYGVPGSFSHCLLERDWVPKLADKARACGIDFLCTAFSPGGYAFLNEWVPAHKVASAELTHVRILEKLRKLGKPVILSTGASGEADIRQALHVLTSCDADPLLPANPLPPVPVILMYCVAAYPAQEIDLDRIPYLAEHFDSLVGYSDHSTDVGVIPRASVLAGACVLEKHFTALPDLKSPDRGHSLTPGQFKRMVERIRGSGAVCFGPSPEETPMILRHNRRLIATRDIAEGEQLTEGVNFGIFRSLKDDTSAASPWLIDQMNGKAVKRAIQAGDGIAPGDV